ncbi:TMV resistance protein N [Eucalyptus grandis]|uniref:TMV resistance protein N n=1 Tax=Eucalyptus grandis TaxID=71139 RepID=UPI00192EB71B|nr:TMV resistance protein N [Eucalyptus grandis]
MRHLRGRWRDAVNAHKENLGEMVVKEWEEALEEVCSLKGWESEEIDNGYEGTLVKIVVRKVMAELKRLFLLCVPEQLVGIDDHVEQIMSKIDAKFNGTRIIGIYGMGGIGKTTLAKVLYNKLSSHFENRSFVADIRETSQREGIKFLQKLLISDIIGSSFDVSSVDEGVNIIKCRFASKKVLILLDDMDDRTNLNALIKDGSWFEVGSIVIITTRNKSILDEARASYMYPLNELSFDQSLILFSRHAFRNDFPHGYYKAISCEIVSTTGGLPLSLEVVGSFLCGRKEEVWKDTLKKLKKAPDKTVQEKLKISYEALDDEEQQIFLDIACFFIGSHKENPTYMWDASDFLPGRGIEVLSSMSLIEIHEYGNLLMHDQLRDLGREIVRLENAKQPQKRSRLWNYEEAADVIDGNKKATELKVLYLTNCQSLKRTPDLSTFKRLEILTLKDCHNLEELHPSIGNLASLIKLNLSETSIMKLPESIGNLQNLRVLNIHRTSLTELPESIGAMKELKVIKAYLCTNLAHIPSSIGSLASLQTLDLWGCHSLTEIPDSIGNLASLIELEACYCKNLERLPSNICKLISLEKLLLFDCEKLRELPKLPSGLTELSITCQGQSLPHLSQLTRLEILCLIDCHWLECVPELPIGLSELYIDGCGKLKAFTNLSDLKHLRHFQIVGMAVFSFLAVPFYIFPGLLLGSEAAEITVTTIFSFVEAEKPLSLMVVSKSLVAKIDWPMGIVNFQMTKDSNEILNSAETILEKLLDLVKKSCPQIPKETTVHKAALRA